jgi:hypothetical protein
MTRGEAFRLGVAVLLGAALAFPAGLILAPREPAPRPPATAPAEGTRAMFSPRVRSDPAFLAALRDNAAALEAECGRSGEFCAEARGAREQYDRLAARE